MLSFVHPVSRSPGAGVALPSAIPRRTLEPPSRAMRASYLGGAVAFQAAGTSTWARAELNRPVAEGDGLWTDGGARAELHLGSAAIRMDSRTRLDFLTFNDWITQARVTQGEVVVTVRRLAAGETSEIDTPNAAVTFLQPGQYRLDVQPAMDSTFVTVRTGDAEVSGTRLDFTAHAGQRANISGPDPMEYGIAGALAPDQFDEFCQMRDRREDTSVSAQYVAPGTIGSYDLDDFGAWRVDEKWGPVWTPHGLGPSWAPYRFGHWAWVELWGWTWIDDAPWGFAPFHYGRWIFLDGAWSWIPGPPNVRPVYAPALVSFVQGGRRVAWFPIANGSVAGAITAVPREVFVRGQPVADARVEISSRQASLARVNGAAPPIAPLEQSLSPRRDRFVLEPPELSPDQTVVARLEPASRPVPFRQSQPILKSHPGRPLRPSELEGLRDAAGEPDKWDVRPAWLSSMEPGSVAPVRNSGR